MFISRVVRNLSAAVAALVMCSSPALASASVVTAPRAISPMVALSIFGSQASAAALCGSSATIAATAQAPAGGCVLPVLDTPPPLPVVEPAPFVPAPVATSGFGLAPILLGLAGIAILAALIISQDNDNDNGPPVSIN